MRRFTVLACATLIAFQSFGAHAQSVPALPDLGQRAESFMPPPYPIQTHTAATAAGISHQKIAATDDDDDNILPMVIAALKPKCLTLTSSRTSVLVGASITLTANCTFKGNLVRKFAFYLTDADDNLVYLNDSTPAGNPSYTTPAPTVPGTYRYSLLALNGNIPSNAVAGVAVVVANNILPTVSITPATAPASIAYSPTATYTVTATANDADQGVTTVQLQWKPNGALVWTSLGSTCTFTAVANTARQCSGNLPANLSTGVYVVRAIATDGVPAATTSAEVDVVIQPALFACTLSMAPNPPTVGVQSTLTATCQSGGTPLTT
jgi:hypothetical protein